MNKTKKVKSNRFQNFLDNKFIPFAGKIGNQRHLSSIRDGFAIFTPMLILGALSILWTSVLFPTGGDITKSTLPGLWSAFNGYQPTGIYISNYYEFMNAIMAHIGEATIDFMAVYAALSISYFLAQSRNSDAPFIAALVSLASFVAVTGFDDGTDWFGSRGLIVAIIISLLSTELFVWLSKGDKLAIKMPAGVPPAVSRAFGKLFPALLTVIVFAGASAVMWSGYHFSGTQLITGTEPGLQIKDGTTLVLTDQEHMDAFGSLLGIETAGEHLSVQELNQNLGGDWSLADNANHIAVTTTGFAISYDEDLTGAVANFNKLFDPTITGSKATVIGGGITGEAQKVYSDNVFITSAVYSWVVSPFISAASSKSGGLGIALAYVFLISFFWFFGLHGDNICEGAFAPLWLILYVQNVNGADNIFVYGTFVAYVSLGGWAATLALLGATLIFRTKGAPEREVAKFAIAPGIFEINEPVTFGYPLVLNVMLIIPILLVMPSLVVSTYFGIGYYGVPPVTILVPWTTPPGLGALIASRSPWGLLLALANLGIAFVIWTPFVILMNFRDLRAKRLEAKTKDVSTNEETEKVQA